MRNVMDLMEGDEGLRDRQGLDASMYVMGYIFKKEGKKNGLAMREPWQEDGSQESERDRQRVTFIMLDKLVGGMSSKKTTWDKKSVREGRER